jgi:hypothetical protein
MAVIDISHNTELFSTILLTKDINTLTIQQSRLSYFRWYTVGLCTHVSLEAEQALEKEK